MPKLLNIDHSPAYIQVFAIGTISSDVSPIKPRVHKKVQSKFDNSKRKGPQEIFRMIEGSNFRKSSKKSEMFGHFHSDNGMVRFDSFNSAFWRIYENLCTWNEENVFIRVLS